MASELPATPTTLSRSKRRLPEAGPDIGLDDQGYDTTPRPRQQQVSPRKRTATSSKKSGDVLEELQKPIHMRAVSHYSEALRSLPADIIPLYERITAANELDGIMPFEVREVVRQMERDKAHYFHPPNPADKGEAMVVFATLRAINRRAIESQINQRDESAWNHLVHTPLLQILFASEIKPDTELYGEAGTQEPAEDTKVRVRMEPIMSASIAGDSVPFLQASSDGLVDLACSVSAESRLVSETSYNSKSNLSLSMMRSRGVKVDYALVMDIPEGTLLRKIIQKVIHTSPLPHINQTACPPIKESPIAVSIETKTDTSAQDPLIQLGIWTAAWYKHMYDLREHLAGPGPKPRLVSVPLIKIVGHQWQVYFAQDLGASIDMFGPFPLGSTASILSTYALYTSLTAVKEWIEEAFYAGVEAWLTVEGAIKAVS